MIYNRQIDKVLKCIWFRVLAHMIGVNWPKKKKKIWNSNIGENAIGSIFYEVYLLFPTNMKSILFCDLIFSLINIYFLNDFTRIKQVALWNNKNIFDCERKCEIL